MPASLSFPERFAELPPTFYIVEAIDHRRGEAFIHQTTARDAGLVDLAMDILNGQHDRYAIQRIIEIDTTEGAATDATRKVLRKVQELSRLTGHDIPEPIVEMIESRRAPARTREAA